MTTLAEFFSLPMTSGDRDRRVGTDELGRAVMQTPMGDQYVVNEQPRTTVGDMVSQGAQAFSNDPLGATGSIVQALAQGAWNGVAAPGNALRGETQTYGDVADTALESPAF